MLCDCTRRQRARHSPGGQKIERREQQRDREAGSSLPLIGAQLSTAGGLEECIARARRIGAEVVQIFPSNPRQWRPSPHSPEVLARFGDAMRRAGLPLYVHTIYLINLASPDEDLRRASATSLADALHFGAVTGATGVVTHIGSHRGDGFERGLARVVAAADEAYGRLNERIARSSEIVGGTLDPPRLLLETSAGGGDSLGRDPAELGRLVRESPNEPGVCLDTAHLYAAGFPLDEPDGVTVFLDELAAAGRPGCVELVHLNDSKTELGSRSDRHENLWDGRYGRTGLQYVMAEERLRSAPFVLEVPGADGHGPDRRNIRRARILRREAAAMAGETAADATGSGLRPTL
jgi:deoxyribonuclease-4